MLQNRCGEMREAAGKGTGRNYVGKTTLKGMQGGGGG